MSVRSHWPLLVRFFYGCPRDWSNDCQCDGADVCQEDRPGAGRACSMNVRALLCSSFSSQRRAAVTIEGRPRRASSRASPTAPARWAPRSWNIRAGHRVPLPPPSRVVGSRAPMERVTGSGWIRRTVQDGSRFPFCLMARLRSRSGSRVTFSRVSRPCPSPSMRPSRSKSHPSRHRTICTDIRSSNRTDIRQTNCTDQR